MENRFAGAADVAQRRRRRLASEPNSDDSDVAENSPPSKGTDASVGPTVPESHLLRRVLSPRLWKHCLILASLVIAVTIMLIPASPTLNLGDSGGQTRCVVPAEYCC